MEIKFGTSGWRGIIGEEVTFQNIEIVTQAICDYIKEESQILPKIRAQANFTQSTGTGKSQIIVGYDTRFFSEKFAQTTSEVIAGNGLTALLTRRDTPTPVIAFEILRRKTAGGINFTASHNPPEYNGIKFSPSWGGPALPETTKQIEHHCKKYLQNPTLVKKIPFADGIKAKKIVWIDPRQQYLKRLSSIVNLDLIGKSCLKIAVDVMYGTGREYLDDLLKGVGAKVFVLHDWRDVLFGGKAPEPSLENIGEMVELVKKEHCHLGVGTDGDADRFGILDEKGNYIPPGHIIAMLLDHLLATRRWKGPVVRSVMTTSFVDAVAKKHNVEIRETPVGFKYIGDILINEGLIIGGEESGGLTVHGHVPEKDGILACLLVIEMAAYHKKPLSQILKELYKKVGAYHFQRVNFHLSFERMVALKAELQKQAPGKIAGRKVTKTIAIDGFKYILEDGAWIGLRLSGTEPVVRFYAEAHSEEQLKKLLLAGGKLVKGK